jgi:hypothetical protein
MSWNPVGIDSETLAVHAALVPNGPQCEMVLFAATSMLVAKRLV